MKKVFLTIIIITFSSLFLVAMDPLPGSCGDPVKTKETTAMKLTVADAVFIALTNNVTLRSAYLDRYLNRIDLQLAERRFYLPTDPALTLSTNRVSTYVPPTAASAAGRIEDLNATGVLSATLAMPTGGTFTFAWNNKSDRPDLGQNFNYSSDWSLTLNQPLLKGGGMDNAAYNVRIARITEEKNVLSLKDTIIATIKTAITAFRSYKTAERQLVIAEMGLVRAKSLYDYNKEMIAAGRLAGTEIVQAQADIATQETSVISAKNNLDATRMALVQALYIDKKTTFQAADENQQLIPSPAMEEAMSLAFQYRTDYLRALQDLEARKLDLAKNKINRLWSLNLTAGTTDSAATTTFMTYDTAYQRAIGSAPERSWNVGLALQIPLVYMTSDMRAYLGAKTDMEKANLAFEKLKLDIEINVQNAVRNVDSDYRSLLSARRARELSERKLDIEQEKLGAGRTTNFQFVSFQRDLQTAQLNELAAMTTYLNTLTSLDDTLGTTLATWKIDVKKEDDRIQQSETAKISSPTNQRDQKNGK
ncbi:MAG: TolC family protein [Deltaproteobacteria bacterium]|nr:TolC family protein [Deltaproteobacteria bacterium]